MYSRLTQRTGLAYLEDVRGSNPVLGEVLVWPVYWRTQRGWVRLPGCSTPHPKGKKNCRRDNIKVLRDFPFSLNQPLKSIDDQYIEILNCNKELRICRFFVFR